jgi:hypothetical protein
MFLVPSPAREGYLLQANAVCFASGFDIEKIQGKMISDIHEAAPS